MAQQIIPNGAVSEDDDYKLPQYSDPGRILVLVGPALTREESVYNHEYEVIDYDGDSCVMWINEGEGFEYWLDQLKFPSPGIYLIEDITGDYHRGNGYTSDDTVHWHHDEPKRVSLWWRFKQWLAGRELP